MTKSFTIKHKVFEFSDEDVEQVAAAMDYGSRGRVKLYTRIQDRLYPVRQLVVEMVRRKGETMPDITTYQAIPVLRALGFQIIEV